MVFVFLLRCNFHRMQAIHFVFWKICHNRGVVEFHHFPSFTYVPFVIILSPHAQLLASKPPIDVVFIPIILPFSECPINRVWYYVTFCVRFFLFSISTFIDAFKINQCFYVYQETICLNSWVVLLQCMYHSLLIYSLANGYIVCFQFLAVI